MRVKQLMEALSKMDPEAHILPFSVYEDDVYASKLWIRVDTEELVDMQSGETVETRVHIEACEDGNFGASDEETRGILRETAYPPE